MDIKINAIGGLPPDSYVGVRIGQAMKQVKYDPEKIFRFPEARRLGKVDIFCRVASADLAWNVGEAETRMCNAVGAHGIVSKLQVSFSPVTREHQGASPKQEFPLPTKQSNKEYMQLHDVEGMLAGAMRALLKEKPPDAPAFIIAYITSRYTATNHAVLACAEPPVPSPVAKVEKPSAPERATPPREGCADLRSKARQADNHQDQAVQTCSIRDLARDTLVRASRENSIERRLLLTKRGKSTSTSTSSAGLPQQRHASRTSKASSSREFYKAHVLPSVCDDAFAQLHSLFRGGRSEVDALQALQLPLESDLPRRPMCLANSVLFGSVFHSSGLRPSLAFV